MDDIDENFFDRADEHINLSNSQLANANKGIVSASMLYSVARFNAWVITSGWNSKNEMENAKEDAIEYFVDQYKKMLKENIEDYIDNFNDYFNKK